MSLLSRFGFGRAQAPASPVSQLGSGQPQAGGSAVSQSRGRRDLLRVVLRETLHRHGIPAQWLEAEVLVSTSRAGERGIHWRLLVKHWDPRLLGHAPAIQQALLKRLTTLDPSAASWLAGVSWQFASPEEMACPPMPHPASWTAAPAPSPIRTLEAAQGRGNAIADAPCVDQPLPAAVTRSSLEGKASLEHLLAVRDGDFRRPEGSEPAGGDATEPMFLRTEPAKL